MERLLREVAQRLGSAFPLSHSGLGGATFAAAGHPDLEVSVEGENVTVQLLEARWSAPHTPSQVKTVIISINWAEHSPDSAGKILDQGVREGHRRLLASLVQCRLCKLSFSPGHMHEDVCHSCAEKHLGIVH
jgi:hypothetical protein